MSKAIQINGLKALQKKLRKNVAMMEVKAVVKSNTADMDRKAQRKVPVDTGFLKRSITLTLASGGLTGIVEPYAEYAAYVEYGTRFMSAQPYMRPAYNAQKVKFLADLNKLMK